MANILESHKRMWADVWHPGGSRQLNIFASFHYLSLALRCGRGKKDGTDIWQSTLSLLSLQPRSRRRFRSSSSSFFWHTKIYTHRTCTGTDQWSIFCLSIHSVPEEYFSFAFSFFDSGTQSHYHTVNLDTYYKCNKAKMYVQRYDSPRRRKWWTERYGRARSTTIHQNTVNVAYNIDYRHFFLASI